MTFYEELFTEVLGEPSRKIYGDLVRNEKNQRGRFNLRVTSPPRKAVGQIYTVVKIALAGKQKSLRGAHSTFELIWHMDAGDIPSALKTLDAIRQLLLDNPWGSALGDTVERLDQAVESLLTLFSRVRSDELLILAENLLLKVELACNPSRFKEVNRLAAAREICYHLWFESSKATLLKNFLDELSFVHSGFSSHLENRELLHRLREVQHNLEVEELWDENTAV